ncbi:hypothetical protein FXO89_22990 [Salmonella enterica]|nr:hypothetical protein [Salmonella enterica]
MIAVNLLDNVIGSDLLWPDVTRYAGRAFMLRTGPLRVPALRVSIPHASAPSRRSALRLASAPAALRTAFAIIS